jgi:hypothetical protein
MSVPARLLLLALLVLAPIAVAQTPAPKPAPAQPSGAHSPIGRWKFETGMVNLNCKLSGEMQVTQAPTTGAYSCKFVAVQSCAGDPPLEFRVQQSCIATQVGKQVTITSKIEKILSVKPEAMFPTVKSGYAADNFEVTMNAAGSEMRGMFRSLNQANVRFWRPNSDLVS